MKAEVQSKLACPSIFLPVDGRGRTGQISLSAAILPEDRAMLDSLKVREGRSRSEIVRRAIRLYYANQEESR